jgi:hypothetical protein
MAQRRTLTVRLFVDLLPVASVAVAVISTVTPLRVRALRSARAMRPRSAAEGLNV